MPRRDDEYDDDRRPDDRADALDRRADRDDREPLPDRPRKRGMSTGAILGIVGAIVLVCGGCVVGGLFFGVVGMRDAANRMKSSNNLKQMALAVHNYNDTYDELPANTYTADGKPLLSWRVHILPFVEQDNLYRQFQLDQPWDSPNNIRLLNQMPRIYVVPDAPPSTGPGLTHYRGFSSPGAVFDRRKVPDDRPVRPGQGFNLGRFKDRTTDTVLIVEAADPVEWTKPDDLDAGPGKPVPKMAGFHRGGKFVMVMADGSVRQLRPDVPETTLRALVTHSGGEPLPPDWDQ